MRHPENEMRLAAVRIMETRERYAEDFFSFANLKNHTITQLKEGGMKLKADYLKETMGGESAAEDG